MNVDEILTQARFSTHLTATQMPVLDGMRVMNIVYQDLVGRIIAEVGEDFFFDIYSTNAVAGAENGEYALPETLSKIRNLSIKPNTNPDEKHLIATQVGVEQLERDWNYFLENQPQKEPIYYIADNSIFIAPQFAAKDVESGLNQIKVYGVKNPVPLVSGGGASTIIIPDRFHPTIAIGMKSHFYESKGKITEAGASEGEYERAINTMITVLSGRVDAPFIAERPINDFYEDLA